MPAQLQHKIIQLFSDQPARPSHEEADGFLTALYTTSVQRCQAISGTTEWAWHALALATAAAWGFVAYSFISATGWQGQIIVSMSYAAILLALIGTVISERRKKSRPQKRDRASAEITVLQQPSSDSSQAEEPEDSDRTARAA